MRVIAGDFKGRILSAPANVSFRPTTDRVKETLFNILAHTYGLRGSDFCDLFAGSGSIGIEALSRAAAHVSFVENNRASLTILKKNIETVKPGARCDIHPVAVESFLTTAPMDYSIIFADPPYAYTKYDSLLQTVLERALVRAHGVFVIEHSGKLKLSVPTRAALSDRRDLGTTVLSFFTFSPEA
jgi:16S rRNA (guanine966-N2)-methyltransferase